MDKDLKSFVHLQDFALAVGPAEYSLENKYIINLDYERTPFRKQHICKIFIYIEHTMIGCTTEEYYGPYTVAFT